MKREHLKRFINRSLLEGQTTRLPVHGRKNLIKLDLNESYFFLNEEIVEELKKLDHFILSSYPEYDSLNEKVASYAKRKVAEVCLTSGSDQAIQMILQLFFHKDDEVVIPVPTFPAYFDVLNIIEARPKTILYKDEGDTFEFPLKETLALLSDSSRGLILCNPNNPLGSSISPTDIRILLEKTKKLNIPVIIDEAYFEYAGETAAPLLDEFDNLIVLRTFSKSFGLAGLRLGYVLAHPNIINELVKLKMPWAVNHFAVHAGEVVLRHQSYFKNKIQEAVERRDKMRSLLESRGLKCYSSKTNFLTVKSPRSKEMINDLKKEKIAVKDLSIYYNGGELLKDAFRINIPSAEDMKSLEKFFSSHSY